MTEVKKSFGRADKLPWDLAKRFVAGKKTVMCFITFNPSSRTAPIERWNIVDCIIRENGGSEYSTTAFHCFADLSEKSAAELRGHAIVSNIRPATRNEFIGLKLGMAMKRVETTAGDLAFKARLLRASIGRYIGGF